MSTIIDAIEKDQLKTDVTNFKVGDGVRVHTRVVEGDKERIQIFAGIVIGFIVFAAIIPVAPVTGASINPARTTGPMFVQSLMGGTVAWEQWPVYVVAELAAGIAAGVLFGLISRTQADRTPLTAAQTEQEARA